jgi:glycosyltransferase involved in cell wall biosynthesis
MPRVLRILNRLAVGGPVLNAAYLTKYLPPAFETILVVGEKEDHEKSASYLTDQLGINYVAIRGMGRSINPVSDYMAYRELITIIKRFKPDIIHTHAAKPGALGRLAAAAAKVPVVVHTFHGHVFHSYFDSVRTNIFIKTERWLAHKTDAIIAISEQQKMELLHQFKIAPEEKLHVIPLGFDLDKFQTQTEEKRARFRKEFDLDDDTVAIGIIGRLVPVKNHYLFLKAIKHVLNNSNRKVKAFIIGDGETRTDLENVARETGIEFSIQSDLHHPHTLVFTSWRSDVDAINAGLDIVCLTSFNEGTPVSLIEAQATNKPIVSTRVGGISDIVLEGQTALLADIDKPEQFCDHLLQLVQKDELRANLGSKGSVHVAQRFSYQRLVNDMSGLYHQLLKKNGSI